MVFKPLSHCHPLFCHMNGKESSVSLTAACYWLNYVNHATRCVAEESRRVKCRQAVTLLSGHLQAVRRSRPPSGSPPRVMASTRSESRFSKINFRVLIIGRANAGKTSILQRVCDTTESPTIYRSVRGLREQVSDSA